jgi:dihydroxyacetone kinase-like protein
MIIWGGFCESGFYGKEETMTVTKKHILQWLEASARVMVANQDCLTRLDSEIGDADHGINMSRGFGIVLNQLSDLKGLDIGTILKKTGMALISSVGGGQRPPLRHLLYEDGCGRRG